MGRNRKGNEGKAERDAQAERARQLRDRIGGLARKPGPKTPRELTDEAAMREFLDEKEEQDKADQKEP
jgi:hypothetical protein